MKLESIQERLLTLVQQEDYRPKLPDGLREALGVTDQVAFQAALDGLTSDGSLVISKKGKVVTPESMGLLHGRYCSSEQGYGFVVPDVAQPYGDLFIPARFSLGAMHKDRVLARVLNVGKDGRADGEIVTVTRRETKTLTGVLDRSKNHGFVICDNKKFCNDIFIPKTQMGNAKDHDKVGVEIVKYSDGRRNAEGKIIEVFGKSGSRGANYSAVLFERGIRLKFPAEVQAEAAAIPQTVKPIDYKTRLDLRDQLIFTIDGPDAKDFDDAISIEKTTQGTYKLGVHIADVSHYVKESSPLDKEAFLRGTSVYFVDQVVPMLPIELSNGICSLNPNVDRLAFSALMEFDGAGNRLSFDLQKTVIRSKERLIYGDVTAVIEGAASPEIEAKYSYIKPTFLLMRELSDLLRGARTRRGAIDFDLPECKILVDKKGNPVDIVPRERGISDKIIEDFMLAANEAVAEFICQKKKPFVFRVHETPDPDKSQAFLKLLHRLAPDAGRDIKPPLSPKDYQALLAAIKASPYERALSTLALRSMQKARYFEQNLGHFGLAADYYCHFTSPIRRYPDLAIHRILTLLLEDKLNPKTEKKLQTFVADASLQSSETELNAAEAERDIDDLYKAIYMQKFLGEEFTGVISGVTSFGFFVELPNTVEGLVSVEALDDDYYVYDEDRLTLTGTRAGKVYRLGDTVTVKVAAANPTARRIDFVIGD